MPVCACDTMAPPLSADIPMGPPLPGRLGDPDMSLATEPRLLPDLLRAMRPHRLHELLYLVPSGADAADDPDAVARFVLRNGDAIAALYARLDYTLPGDKDKEVVGKGAVTREVVHIPGPDDSQVLKLVIYRPAAATKTNTVLPGVVYLHGGGMVILKTEDPMHASWARALACTGVVVVAVDFRNALSLGVPDEKGAQEGKEEKEEQARVQHHPFPAGLDDCCAAVRWIDAHRTGLGISKLVLQGESGGANLALAVTLRARREGWLFDPPHPSSSSPPRYVIDGVCASVPYIAGPAAYGAPRAWRARHLPSLVECDGYLISCATSVLTARMYTFDPSAKDRGEGREHNPLAWPYWVPDGSDDLHGLPPHLVAVNELDPLRDEGIAYARKLANASVRVVARVNLGVIHEGELFLRRAVPDVFRVNMAEIKAFIDGL